MKAPTRRAPLRSRPAKAAAGPARDQTVLLIFEMPRRQFHRLKGQFDKLIARHDLVCHLRFEEGP